MQESSTSKKFGGRSADEQRSHMENYYKLQSKIYDTTRWSFLFGRKQIIREIPLSRDGQWNILEVGCGTGYNLERLAKQFPNARITGLDVSTDMYERSQKRTAVFGERVQVKKELYKTGDNEFTNKVDAILFSYSLTMINPQWKDLVLQAKHDLKPGGYVAFTDFHDSNNEWFKQHMSNHHVRMDSHVTPVLEQEFETVVHQVKPAYGGVWHYVVHVGRKR